MVLLGRLMLDLEGLMLTAEERDLLLQPQVGGLILFARNFESPTQLRSLMNDIRELRPDLLVAVDQEGGRVQRFKTGFTRFPPMRLFGQWFDEAPELARSACQACGYQLAAELIDYDIDFSFAPVLDLDWGRSAVIGDRAFHASPAVVAELASAFIKGMNAAGMPATGKHFPGHGWCTADSHVDVPVDDRDHTKIEANDMAAFRAVIDTGLDAIMPAHVIYPSIDRQPAGFSRRWLQDILRSELGFDGVIFSDDLAMEGAGVAGGWEARCDAALQAGCDMVLVCNDREGALAVLAHLQKTQDLGSARLSKLRVSTRQRQTDTSSFPNWLAEVKRRMELINGKPV